MSVVAAPSSLSVRERELAAIISSYNEVTDRLKSAHELLTREVTRLRDQLDEKNRELARQERLAALGEMAAGVAHEIRNPLAGIQLFASMLEEDLADRPAQAAQAAKISNGVRALDGIVSDILAFAGHGEIQLEAVEVTAVIHEALELAAPRRSSAQAKVHANLENHSLSVRAHPVQLQRAVLNLLFNALDAVAPGGNVWIECRADQERRLVHLTVADDGPGVPNELRQRIFDPFYTGRESGTGLGLAIVHRIAEAHEGSVRVTERPGGGAVFTLTLPSVDGEGNS